MSLASTAWLRAERAYDPGVTTIHRRRWIMLRRWQYRADGQNDVIIEVIQLEGRRYGVLWAKGDDLRIKGNLDRQSADKSAQAAMEKISPDGWLDMSVI